ncbi:MAG: heavy metal-responsive transcriptional regulator [Micavibrio sp.]|nr:heavy metal-responsive transcriptional regulator [Micavibrio sp.]|tara:strand:+ start:259461 stop:259874 length:414 start_codon:yes stop_codon:yes gene_type:complete
MENQKMSIGQLSKATNTSKDTIRYYETIGLLQESPRSNAGYRIFDCESVRRLRLIKNAKSLGFKLSEIEEIIQIIQSPDGTAQQLKLLVESKISSAKNNIKSLEKMQTALEKLFKKCPGGTISTDICPIQMYLMEER